MSFIEIIFLILSEILIHLQASKICDFSYCNYEGQCFQNDKNENYCKCIGAKYFEGPNCSQPIDNCLNTNPCKNGGKCKSLAGQFICENCKPGFNGIKCDIEAVDIFEKMLIYFNHYGFYGEKQKFLIIVENLGNRSVSLELMSDNYAIASFETKITQKNNWIYKQDLRNILKSLKLRYYEDLPYTKGYYHLATQTFWTEGLLELNLRSYDTFMPDLTYYENKFDLLIINNNENCVPQLSFIHGLKPLEPLTLDIASYNNFEIILKKKCFQNSITHFQWSVYNSIGSKKLHDFGHTEELILKIPPYKLWFHYHEDVMSSYRIAVKMLEEYGNQKLKTEARCYILVWPKPITANIKGGYYREIGIKQELILDASDSRDFALPPKALQDFLYKWDCVSEEDNKYCQENMGTVSILKIKSNILQLHKTYNFSLKINSKINYQISDHTYQIIKILENSQLQIDIKCLRNCERNEYRQDDLIHLKAISLDKEFSNSVTYQWTLKDQLIGEKEHLTYKPKEIEQILEFKLKVQNAFQTGQVYKTFKINWPPYNGSCAIQPSKGEAFLTKFWIKCENYIDQDNPLSYEYLEENRFPLQRTNEPEIYTKLSGGNKVLVKICDQFKACIETNMEVKVREMKKNFKDVLWDEEKGLRKLLLKGDYLTVMILLKSITNSVKSVADLNIILKEMKSLDIPTLLHSEQFLEVTKTLLINNLPLKSEKAFIFNQFLWKLYVSFQRIIKDQEIFGFTKVNYEKSFQDIINIMQQFSYNWENITKNHFPEIPTILASNPLGENYKDLPDFNINVVKDLRNWLDVTKNILESFNLMIWGAKEIYAPWEQFFSLKENNTEIFIYSFDNSTQQNISFHNNSLTVTLNQNCIMELQNSFADKEILLQIAFLKTNPFWWYPTATSLNSNILLFSAFSRKSTKSLNYLKNPFEFQLKLKPLNSSNNEIFFLIKNNTHMPLFSLDLPPNAILLLNFLKIPKPLKCLIQNQKPPLSLQILKNGFNVKSSNFKQTFFYLNPLNKTSITFLAFLMKDSSKYVTFSFVLEIRECLYWDFSLKDPQWSSQGCKPKLNASQNNNILSCLCHHLSAFTARSSIISIREDLREHILLEELSLNYLLVIFYLVIVLLSLLLVVINFFQLQTHKQFIPINSFNTTKYIEISIYSGSLKNSNTSANISLKIITLNDAFAVNIYQNPENPFLKRNSICKFHLNSLPVHLPIKLSLSNSLNGRYPSWFCNKIIIKNLQTQQLQIFNINQWVCQYPLEITSSNSKSLKFRKLYHLILSQIYLNWFQYQPLWGCWQYNDLNRLERCCIWLCQFMGSIGLVAVYFGCTNLETYEEERLLYYSLNFDFIELFILSALVYVLNIGIRFIFEISLWLLERIYKREKKKFRKFV